MEKVKKWIIILVIFIIILIATLLIIFKVYPNLLGALDKNELTQPDISVDIEKSIVPVKDYNTFFSIEKNLQNYCLYLKIGNSKALHDILSQEYMTKQQITQENITNYLPKIEDDDYEFILKQLYVNDSESNQTYYAYGEVLQNKGKDQHYYVVYTDQVTLSIQIEPITKQEFENRITESKNNEEREIARNEYNKYTQITVTKEDVAQKYFKTYIYQALHEIEEAYASLEEEYKNAKYTNLQSYMQYIASRKIQLETMDIYSIKKQEEFASEEQYVEYIANLEQKGLSQYGVTNQNGNTQYICIDDYGSYYIFRETSPMNYTVILDTYTVDLPEFTEKYAQSTDEQKVLLNIQRFFEAINQADYSYAYSKLDETYKANNFKTVQEFEAYVKQNFYAQNKLSAGNPEKQNDIYLYTITISDASGKTEGNIIKTFVMQLKEGTDFVMSFNK